MLQHNCRVFLPKLNNSSIGFGLLCCHHRNLGLRNLGFWSFILWKVSGDNWKEVRCWPYVPIFIVCSHNDKWSSSCWTFPKNEEVCWGHYSTHKYWKIWSQHLVSYSFHCTIYSNWGIKIRWPCRNYLIFCTFFVRVKYHWWWWYG